MDRNKECERVSALLEQFMDGELTAQEQDLVKEELAGCQQCRARFDRLQKLRALVREVYVDEVRTADLSELLPGVMERIKGEKVTVWNRLANWVDKYRLGLASPVAPLGVAATLVVVVMAATLVYVSSNTPHMASPSTGAGSQGMAAEEAAPTTGETVELARKEEQPKVSGGVLGEGPGQLAAAGNRRPRHEEKPFRKNECHVTYYNVDNGIVIVDVDPDGDAPTVVWHFPEEGAPSGEEDNRI